VVADLLGTLDLEQLGSALTDLMASLVVTALEVATRAVEAERGGPLGTQLLVVGMGRFGGGELGYGSDADVMFVHDPRPDSGLSEDEAQRRAGEVVQEVRRLLALPGPDGPVSLDADLRPEGKNGPLVRSLESYRAYYERWSLTWESQALVRATPVAGNTELGSRFTALADPLRWPKGGLSAQQVREVRRLKARMEAERLPRGANPRNHFKLGLGGLSDVEWTVQLIQMCHAHEVPALRTTATLPALDAAVAAGYLPDSDGEALREAWIMASRMRNSSILFRGRPVESLPADLRDADGIGRIMGFEPGSGHMLAERYLRVARRSRAAVTANFYGGA
jgi:[glutamine synthetase] adenylyltransferase / [glutamine synthetase]-adenylyl-L-tyrosine phosphorylase